MVQFFNIALRLTDSPFASSLQSTMDYAKALGEWLDRHPPVPKEPEEEPSRRALGEERRALRRLRPEARLDLHGLTVEEALGRADRFLRDSKDRGFRKVLIIHGKGNHSAQGRGVLREKVRELVRNHPLSGETGVPDPAEGGDGAIWVIVR